MHNRTERNLVFVPASCEEPLVVNARELERGEEGALGAGNLSLH